MNNKLKLFSFIAVLVVLVGCKGDTSKTVSAVFGNLLEPVSISSTPDFEFGEMITTDDGIDITLTVANNSSDELRELLFTLDTSENILDWRPNIDGVSISPGAGGTCKSTLVAGSKCTYRLVMTARKQGEFTVPGTISYLNRAEPQKREIKYHLISGEPASLVFTNDISNYNFGVLEQTEVVERFLDLEVKNAGGLSARDLSVMINNDDISGAYKLISHDCPKNLLPKQTCKAKVSYTPKNNNYTDPETVYTGQLIFDYIKDPMINTGRLNGYFSFTSSTIEAKFKTNYAQVDFGTVVTGNKEMRMIKLINMGYREGILKELIFKRADDSIGAICTKGSGSVLQCSASTLYDFPFIIEDTNSCFDQEVVSYLSPTGSPNCVFKVTYWPSIQYASESQALHDFNLSNISFKFDSHWKGQINIVTKSNVFNVQANFQARASIEITRVELNGQDIGASKIISGNSVTLIDLGRLAKIAPGYSSVYYPVKIYYKNTGEVPAAFLKLEDGRPVPSTIIDINESSPGPSIARDYNEYYKALKQDSCLILGPGSECSVTFNLAPVKKASQDQEDSLMYDDITNAFNKFKVFSFYYSDGSSFNDDGSPATDRKREARLSSLLIAKGKLYLTPNSNLSFGSNIVSGTSMVSKLLLKNIGTGKIAALQYSTANTLEVPSANVLTYGTGAATGIDHYPYRMSKFSDHAEAVPPSADMDCLDIFHASAEAFPFAIDSSKILDEGKTCALRLEAKLPKNLSTITNVISLTTDEYKRFWAQGLSNTEELWHYRAVPPPSITAKFNYWDGDDNSANDPLSSSYFGYKMVSDPVTLTSGWVKPAMLYISKIEPIASATLIRPAMTYPSIVETFPFKKTLASSTLATSLFANTDLSMTSISTVAQRGINIKTFFNTLDSSLNGPTIPSSVLYMGSVKKNTDLYSTVSFSNYGAEVPSEVKIIDAGGDPGFTVLKFSSLTGPNVFLPINSGTNAFDIIIRANISAAGSYQHCYEVIYTTSSGERNYKFCAAVNVINTMANIKVEYKTNDVSWNTNTSSFDITPSPSWTIFKSPSNTLSVCNSSNNNCTTPAAADEILTFSTVSSTSTTCISGKNCLFDKKTVQITNTGDAPLTDFKIDFSKLPAGQYVSNPLLYKMDANHCANPANYFNDIQNKIAVCQSEINNCDNLAPGLTCTLNFYYTPTITVTATSDSMFVFSYKTEDRSGIAANAFTYVNHYLPVKYEGLASATPVAYQFMRSGVDVVAEATIPITATYTQNISAPETTSNWSDPLNPKASESTSFPVKLGAYSVGYTASSTIVNSYYVVNTNPKTMKIYITLKNTSGTRISFLKANPNPTTAMWNQVYPEWDNVANAFKTYNAKNGAGKAKIYASEGCFFGEVKDDVNVNASNKGFNSTTDATPSKKCQLRMDFSGDVTYSSCNTSTKAKTVSIGGDIDINCNPYVYLIPYWSYKRSTGSTFKVHVREFIEPNRASYTGNITNISSQYLTASTAKISFTLPSNITETLPSLGTISKYRIFWSKDPSYLRTSEIFKKLPSTANICYADTGDASLPKTINLTTCSNSALSIAPGKYWYIKIMTIRNTDATHPNQTEASTFTSDPKIPVLMVATPNNANLAYVDNLKSFIDTGLIDTSNTYNYTNAVSKCSATANNLSVTNGAANVANPRSLINFSVWSYIRTGNVPSTIGQGYTAMGPGYLPHWLADAAVGINTSAVKLYNGSTLTGGYPGFNSATQSASNSSNLISYNKGCTTSACNNLYVIAGGDNDSTFANGVFYTFATNKAGFVRCYVPLICPINTAKKLSDSANCYLKY